MLLAFELAKLVSSSTLAWFSHLFFSVFKLKTLSWSTALLAELHGMQAVGNGWPWLLRDGRHPLSCTVVRQWDKACRQLLWELKSWTSPSVSVSCWRRIAHARFLSDTTHCPVVTSKTVCLTSRGVMLFSCCTGKFEQPMHGDSQHN